MVAIGFNNNIFCIFWYFRVKLYSYVSTTRGPRYTARELPTWEYILLALDNSLFVFSFIIALLYYTGYNLSFFLIDSTYL